MHPYTSSTLVKREREYGLFYRALLQKRPVILRSLLIVGSGRVSGLSLSPFKRVLDFGMGWLRLVGFLKLQVSFAKEPYKRDHILQKRPVILALS